MLPFGRHSPAKKQICEITIRQIKLSEIIEPPILVGTSCLIKTTNCATVYEISQESEIQLK